MASRSHVSFNCSRRILRANRPRGVGGTDRTEGPSSAEWRAIKSSQMPGPPGVKEVSKTKTFLSRDTSRRMCDTDQRAMRPTRISLEMKTSIVEEKKKRKRALTSTSLNNIGVPV